MNSITSSCRYLPHMLDTRYHACLIYRNNWSATEVCRRYKVSKASLMRWNKRFDGTKESLLDHSHRPKATHPTAHTALEIKWIRDYVRRQPRITSCELYGKLKMQKGYARHPGSLYRVMRKLGLYPEPKKKADKYTPKPYDTPSELGIKWQMDVKYVPKDCYKGPKPVEKLYQYTLIDEASRLRFIYAYQEQSSYSTCDFMKRAISFFGYKPQIVQTDNGAEFAYLTRTKRIHPVDILCNDLGITHKRIRPRTPRHNGKVERSHRNDQQRFYNQMNFYSYEDLQRQMKQYLKRSNNIPMRVLNYLSPKQMQKKLEYTLK